MGTYTPRDLVYGGNQFATESVAKKAVAKLRKNGYPGFKVKKKVVYIVSK